MLHSYRSTSQNINLYMRNVDTEMPDELCVRPVTETFSTVDGVLQLHKHDSSY
jgi:hypothetical protein